MGSILGPTWVCRFSQVESSTSGFTPSGGSSSVSMVGIQVIFVSYYEASVYISYIAVHW